MVVKNVSDHVLEIEKYTELDYEFADNFFSKRYDNWKRGCTAVAKTISNGDTIVGRNMDLYISDKPAYIIRTECAGKYKTVGISYINKLGPDYETAKRDGISEEVYKVLPFLSTDIMNSQGLYIETNMRTGENSMDGSSKFGCDGTNPNAEVRVCALNLPRYLAEHCANVKEAVKAVQEKIDVYTTNMAGLDWNFCFLMADSSGDYGIMEIAKNKVVWLDKEQFQANFYLTKEFAEDEDMAAGLGRCELVMRNIDKVQSESDMYELIKQVSYFQVYSKNPNFDVRSEFVGIQDNWTIDYILDEKNQDEIQNYMDDLSDRVQAMSRAELEAENKYWESIFTVIANCNKKTMQVRFFENDNNVQMLSIN